LGRGQGVLPQRNNCTYVRNKVPWGGGRESFLSIITVLTYVMKKVPGGGGRESFLKIITVLMSG